MEPWYTLFNDISLRQIYNDYTIACNAVAGAIGVIGRWIYKRSLKKETADVVGTGEKESPAVKTAS